jgi:hypothetical protein
MNHGPKHYAYDVESGLFTYTAENGIFTNNEIGDLLFWSGTLSWSALINQSGELVEGGLMTWRADYGTGLDIRATGKVIDFNPRIACSDSGLCVSLIPYATIETTYIDPALASVLGHFWQSELWANIFSPWKTDFSCDGGCGFSGHNVQTYNVSEPTSLGLFGLALTVLGFAGRRPLRTMGEKLGAL